MARLASSDRQSRSESYTPSYSGSSSYSGYSALKSPPAPQVSKAGTGITLEGVFFVLGAVTCTVLWIIAAIIAWFASMTFVAILVSVVGATFLALCLIGASISIFIKTTGNCR